MAATPSPGLIVRFRPVGPWRPGADSGRSDDVDRIYHSDTLYSAVCSAMARLGLLEEWLSATARQDGPAVLFSSCFPWQDETLYVVPPRNLWPPQAGTKVRWKAARFVPVSLARSLIEEKPVEEERWIVDAPSGCLLPIERRTAPTGPFRVALRTTAAVDRVSGVSGSPHTVACLEFAERAGLWCLAAFAGEEARERWSGAVQSALRLLADSGLGGERSRGWGRSETPLFEEGRIDELLYRPAASGEAGEESEAGERAWWLLSLFSPSPSDQIAWDRGRYSILVRGGRVEGATRWGEEKKALRMVAEGSVLLASGPLQGAAPDVAPDGFPHPVYRAGFALAVPVPWRVAS